MLLNGTTGGNKFSYKKTARVVKKSIRYWFRQARFHKRKLLFLCILLTGFIFMISLALTSEKQSLVSPQGPKIPPVGGRDQVIPKPPEEQKKVEEVWKVDEKYQERKDVRPVDVDMHEVYQTLMYDNKDGGVWKQGWEVTYPQSALNDTLHVFVVPHSHNDPGWIQTYKNYYETQTRNILNNVVNSLLKDSRRKFIWAEVSFFKLWWDEQSPERQVQAKTLFHNGQLEFVTGGWVMNDEANTNIYAMLSQMLTGIHWLSDNLDISPQHGWAIDPFGHTPTMAYVLKQLGLESLLIQRVHYRIKKYLAKNKQLEFLWRQCWNPSDGDDILTHLMPFYSYDIPHTCGPEPAVCCQFDFARLAGMPYDCPAHWKFKPKSLTGLTNQHVAEQARKLVDQYRKKAELYQTNFVIAPLGDDFRYQRMDETEAQFENYQAIFDYANNDPSLNVQLQFGTLRDYFSHILESKSDLPILKGSFFTYADINEDYWSGYYTTRAYYKNMDRLLESELHAAEVLYGLALANGGVDERYISTLVDAHQNLGVFQHHDGITGTAKEHVVIDYGKMLMDSLTNTRSLIGVLLGSFGGDTTADLTGNEPLQSILYQDAYDSLPEMKVIESSYQLVLFNSRSHAAKEVVIQYLNFDRVCVVKEYSTAAAADDASGGGDSDGDEYVNFQLNEAKSQKSFPEKVYQISFVAEVMPLTAQSYRIIQSNECSPVVGEWKNVEEMQEIRLKNDKVEYVFDRPSGLLKFVEKGSEKHKLEEQFMYYMSGGGAYLFLPNPQAPIVYDIAANSKHVEVLIGPFVQEVHIKTPALYRIARLTSVSDGLLMEHIIDISKQTNSEFIVRYSTDLENDAKLHGDLNGFQIETYHIRHDMPTQYNYFPMPNMMGMEDLKNGNRLTVHTNHAAGAGSISDGQLEVMLDRTLSRDDNRGLGQGVVDNVPARLKYMLLFEKPKTVASEGDISHRRSKDYRFRPSLLSYDVSEELNHPLEMFYKTEGSAHKFSDDLCVSCEVVENGGYRIVKWDVPSMEEQSIWLQKYDFDETFGCVKNCQQTRIPKLMKKSEITQMDSGAMWPFSIKTTSLR